MNYFIINTILGYMNALTSDIFSYKNRNSNFGCFPRNLSLKLKK